MWIHTCMRYVKNYNPLVFLYRQWKDLIGLSLYMFCSRHKFLSISGSSLKYLIYMFGRRNIFHNGSCQTNSQFAVWRAFFLSGRISDNFFLNFQLSIEFWNTIWNFCIIFIITETWFLSTNSLVLFLMHQICFVYNHWKDEKIQS